MTEFRHERSVLHAEDGHEIHLQVWRPSGPATHIIQIAHGLGEHSDRYAQFAVAATARGCIVCCHDHRGHGENSDELGHFADTDGWHAVVNDLHAVNRQLRESHAGTPLILLGHSMGSYIAQFYAMHFGANVNALILSASTLAPKCIYFSASVYTTVGFGDIVPIGPIRAMTGTEGITGLVLITWSASFALMDMLKNWNEGD